MTPKVYPGVPTDADPSDPDTEAGAREGDSREGTADNRCGAETADGGTCSRIIGSGRERCWQHRESGDGDGKSESDAPPATVERRLGVADVPTNALDAERVTAALEPQDGDPFEGVAYKPAPSDTRATSAAKAVARERHGSLGNAAPYLKNEAVFGECERDGCERFANGYERSTCNRHDPPVESQDGEATDDDVAEAVEGASEGATTDAPDGGDGITVKLPDGTVMSGLTYEQARDARERYGD